jgi:hypothetical protein
MYVPLAFTPFAFHCLQTPPEEASLLFEAVQPCSQCSAAALHPLVRLRSVLAVQRLPRAVSTTTSTPAVLLLFAATIQRQLHLHGLPTLFLLPDEAPPAPSSTHPHGNPNR